MAASATGARLSCQTKLTQLHYYPETDSLFIELSPGAGAEVRVIAECLNADLDAQWRVVGSTSSMHRRSWI